jgi:hypothetical protein
VTSESDLADAARKIEQGRVKDGDTTKFGDISGTIPAQKSEQVC